MSKQDLKEAMLEVLGDINQQSQAANQAYYRKMSKFKKEPDYGVVGEHFEKALQDPVIHQAMQSVDEFGEPVMTMDSLYSGLRGRILAKHLKESIDKIPKDLRSSTPAKEPETTDRNIQPMSPDEEKKRKIKKAIEQGDAEAVLNQLIPDNDPILRY